MKDEKYKIYYSNTWNPSKTHAFYGKKQLCNGSSIGPHLTYGERKKVSCKSCIKYLKKFRG